MPFLSLFFVFFGLFCCLFVVVAVWPSGSVEARLSLSTDFFSQMGL